jgi:hypothetical protein
VQQIASDRSNAPRPRWARLLLALPPLLLALWLAGWTGNDAQGQPLPGAHADFLWTLLSSLPFAAAWLASAWGYGWGIARWILKWNQAGGRPRDAVAIEIGLGIAAMLVLDVAAGTLGGLQFGGALGAWAVLLAGLALLVARAALSKSIVSAEHSQWFALAWLAAAPAIAVLILAACSAPGWLWRTEFGGYDALSYHLQLPREWLVDGRMHGLTHNVYSFMPNYMEAAYYHLAVLIGGDGIQAASACQLLHAAFAILAAWITARLAYRFAGKIAGFAAFVAIIGTPWMVVTGSLAYNEMTVLLLLACAALALAHDGITPTQRAAIAGLLAGAACGAKLTSIGFVALPLAVFASFVLPRNRILVCALLGAATFTLALIPYVVRNLIETGNPVFPFATSLFGFGHFTPEQAQIWSAGHAAPASWGARFGELWNQFLRYGLGPNPSADEPWVAQWSVLPWLGVIGLSMAMLRAKLRMHALRVALLLVIQIAFWLLFTHVKSRFLLATSLPLALGVGLGAAAVSALIAGKHNHVTNVARGAYGIVGLMLAVAWCAQPMLVIANEPWPDDPAPAARVGRIDLVTGDAFSHADRAQLAGVSHIIAINELPQDARILLVGESAPFYLRGNISYQTTWDRGPMSHVMREFPDDPRAWFEQLRGQGFTHLFINASMLERWERAGWNDPLITAKRITSATEAHAERVQVTPSGVLYRLK